MKYKAMIAFLVGAGFMCLVSLLLRLPFGLFLSLFLAPGAIVLAPLSKSPSDYSITAIFVADILFYSAFTLLWLYLPALSVKLQGVALRPLAAKVAIPVTFLMALACFPSLNVLWPHHMNEVKEEQRDLLQELPIGMSAARAREVLQLRNIPFTEQQSAGSPDNLELLSRTRTDAWQFPCGFDRYVFLRFSKEGILENRDIRSFPMCP